MHCSAQRWYGLNKRATGEHSWAMNRSAKEAERDNEPAPSLGTGSYWYAEFISVSLFTR